jgi:putative endonuclease
MKPAQSFQRQQLGKLGENIAATFLQKAGYKIIGHNFKGRYGELDLIALHNNILVFIEVKTRNSRDYGLPEESVTPRKLREVVQTAQFYKSLHPELPEAMRIDVIAIELNTDESVKALRHIQNVTL